jgi:hypothetical protein
MGVAWLESPDAKAGIKGLAGDLHAVSAIRISPWPWHAMAIKIKTA